MPLQCCCTGQASPARPSPEVFLWQQWAYTAALRLNVAVCRGLSFMDFGGDLQLQLDSIGQDLRTLARAPPRVKQAL